MQIRLCILLYQQMKFYYFSLSFHDHNHLEDFVQNLLVMFIACKLQPIGLAVFSLYFYFKYVFFSNIWPESHNYMLFAVNTCPDTKMGNTLMYWVGQVALCMSVCPSWWKCHQHCMFWLSEVIHWVKCRHANLAYRKTLRTNYGIQPNTLNPQTIPFPYRGPSQFPSEFSSKPHRKVHMTDYLEWDPRWPADGISPLPMYLHL